MITPTDKRQASLTLLQRLRRQGAPREEKMESMFDSLPGIEVAAEESEEEQDGEPEYELRSPEQEERVRQKKKKKVDILGM